MSISLLSVGFVFGMRHALEADHLAAVASLATGSTSIQQTIKQGAVWGLGHTITLFIFASIALLVDSIIPKNYAAALEAGVGFMLLLLGLDVLRRLRLDNQQAIRHPKIKISKQHQVPHQRLFEQSTNKFPKRALLVGFMHGLAGSAALLILTIQHINTPILSLLYIALFGLGSILGMTLLSCVIAVPLYFSAGRMILINNQIHLIISLVTMTIGSLIVYDYLQS